jgi:hypothetical protein
MSKASGRKIVMQLIRAYEEEERFYLGIERAVVEQHDVLRNGRDPVRLNELVEVQRELAEHIGKIDAGIAPLREHWEHIRDADLDDEAEALADVLDTILDRLADRIHLIVEVERENTEELLEPTCADRVS